MQLLSSRWSVSFGRFTLNGALSAEDLDRCLEAAAAKFAVPEHPESEMRLPAPCGLYDPAGPVAAHRFLDSDGNTWLGVGTRLVANTPNPAMVEAEFRRRAADRFGPEWGIAKKRILNGIRRTTKREMAARTPFRLSEVGAIFICVQSGEIVTVGNAGMTIAKDLVGRVSALSAWAFRAPEKENAPKLLSILRRQEDSILPWPTGTASLKRKRGDVKESCSVRMLNWSAGSEDAASLIAQHWLPEKIQMNWGDGRFGVVDLTGLTSVRWVGNISVPDPHETVEIRLSMLLEMDRRVRALIVEAGAPVLLEDA